MGGGENPHSFALRRSLPRLRRALLCAEPEFAGHRGTPEIHQESLEYPDGVKAGSDAGQEVRSVAGVANRRDCVVAHEFEPTCSEPKEFGDSQTAKAEDKLLPPYWNRLGTDCSLHSGLPADV